MSCYSYIVKIILIVSLICALMPLPVLADYNPASGEDEFVIISEAKEVSMGKSMSKNVEKQFGLSKDSGLQVRVDEIGQKIVSVCDRTELTYSFRVLAGERLPEEARHNAFALPGGYVYIFPEMIGDTQSDDELAAILAHEVGHIVARHSVKKAQNSIGLGALSIIGAVAPSDRHSQHKASFAITELMMAYSRKAEFEADKLSVKYLKAAGYDPKAAVNFIDRMLDKQLKGKIRRYYYFRTHPYISERRAMLNKEIGGSFAFDDYINAPTDLDEPYW